MSSATEPTVWAGPEDTTRRGLRRESDFGRDFGRDVWEGLCAGESLMTALLLEPVAQAWNFLEHLKRSTWVGSGGGCEVPPPCWVPEHLGTVVSHVCPGAMARIRFRVSNCGTGPTSVSVEATGADAGLVSTKPKGIVVEPYEQGVITATLTATERPIWDFETLLWVRGCRQHVLRWIVRESPRGCATTHEIDIEDCPDLVHHWYDHFYCERPCSCPGGRHE